MKWYFMHPKTKEKVYLCLEERYAEYAWDFIHRKGLSITRLTREASESLIKTFEALYELDEKEEALNVINWVFYFQCNADPNFSNYITIRGE